MNRKSEEPGLAAREGAAILLSAVLKEKQAFDDALAAEASGGRLARAEPRDRAFARAIAATALRRLGQPSEVADMALFLTSDQARFVTGQTVDVAGGWLMT